MENVIKCLKKKKEKERKKGGRKRVYGSLVSPLKKIQSVTTIKSKSNNSSFFICIGDLFILKNG